MKTLMFPNQVVPILQACPPSASKAFCSGLSNSLSLAHKAVPKCLPEFGKGGNSLSDRKGRYGHRPRKRKPFHIHSKGESGDQIRSILLINKDLKL